MNIFTILLKNTIKYVCVWGGEFVSEWVSRDWNIPRNDSFYNLCWEKVLEKSAAAFVEEME